MLGPYVTQTGQRVVTNNQSEKTYGEPPSESNMNFGIRDEHPRLLQEIRFRKLQPVGEKQLKIKVADESFPAFMSTGSLEVENATPASSTISLRPPPASNTTLSGESLARRVKSSNYTRHSKGTPKETGKDFFIKSSGNDRIL